MFKIDSIKILTAEIPDEISLGISVKGCPKRCEGCHSSYLWDIGDLGTLGEENSSDSYEVSLGEIEQALKRYEKAGLTCILFLGGDWEHMLLESLLRHLKAHYDLKLALYTGCNLDELLGLSELLETLDYLKVGPYMQELGGLSSRKTNQKLFKIQDKNLLDITYHFWR